MGFLQLWLSLPLPRPDAHLAWLLPSADLVALLALFAFLAWGRLRVHRGVLVALSLLCLSSRLRLLADGVAQHTMRRSFHLFGDLPLLPELARLLHSTLGWAGALGVGLGALALSALGAWLTYLALGHVAAALWAPRLQLGVAGLCVVLGASALLWPGADGDDAPRLGLMAAPQVPVLVGELRELAHGLGLDADPVTRARRGRVRRAVAESQRELATLPPAPEALRGRDVHLILVEAYGHATFATAAYRERIRPALGRASGRLGDAGFSICTTLVDAPTFGGGSWYSHATLQTGIEIRDQLAFDVLFEHRALETLARAFRRSGHRTVSVKPGTTRPSPHTRLFDFDQEYAYWHFGYRGPRYAWAPLADQFVLDWVRHNELARPGRGPLFVEYALVSSHYPFAPLPKVMRDWDAIGDGFALHALGTQPPSLAGDGVPPAGAAYLDAIAYDLDVVSDYLARFVEGQALVLLMGDHQPTTAAAGDDPSWAAPLHVISRDRALLSPFERHGCEVGMWPALDATPLPMARLFPQLLIDYGGAAPAKEAP